MGFQVTPPTATPVDPDGSQNQAEWGEAGPEFTVPSMEGAGFSNGNPLTANDINYPLRQDARWSRATVNRTVLSDEGFLSSCVLRQGTFNVGGGTLEITLTPTRVVIDAATAPGDGGVALEVKIPAGDKLILAAERDTYVSFKEDGTVALQVELNGEDPPAALAGHVQIWVLVTDATELTAVNLTDGIAPYPCFGPIVGARAAVIEKPTLGGKAADPVIVTGAMAVAEVASFDAGIKGTGAAAVTLVEGAILSPSKSVLGDVSTTVQAGALTALADLVALGKATTTDGYEGVAGTAAVLPSGARYVAGAAPTTIGQTTFNSDGEALHHNGDHVRAPGARASGSQESATVAAQITTTMQTGKRQTAPVSLNAVVSVYIQRSAAGSVTLRIEEDNGQDGGGQVWSTLGSSFLTPQLSGSFLLVQFRRVRTADSTARYFRLRADSGGGTTQIMQEGALDLRPLD